MVTQKTSRNTKLAIGTVGALSFIGILIETSMNVTFPTLMRTFHVSLSLIQWITTGYLLLVTIVMGTSAYVMKRVDARQIFRFAVSCCLVGTVFCSTSFNFELLLIGRLLQAVATGLATPLLFNIILTKVPKQVLGMYIGIAEMMVSLAPALGPTYGGLLTNDLSWRWIFLLMLPLIVILWFLGETTIRFKADGIFQKFDRVGLVLISGFLITLIWAFNEAGKYGFTTLHFGGWLVVAILLLVLQVAHSHRDTAQLLDWAILRNKIISMRLFSYFLMQFINVGISFLIPMVVENVLGTSPLKAGLILFPGALIGAVIAPIAGRIYDHHGLTVLIILSNALILLGSGLFIIYMNQLSLIGVGLLFVLIRIGFNLGFGNLMSAASQLVSPAVKADQNSLFNMFQQYAGSLGTCILAALISASSLTISSTKQATTIGGLHGFWMIFVLAFLSLLASLLANRRRLK